MLDTAETEASHLADLQRATDDFDAVSAEELRKAVDSTARQIGRALARSEIWHPKPADPQDDEAEAARLIALYPRSEAMIEAARNELLQAAAKLP